MDTDNPHSRTGRNLLNAALGFGPLAAAAYFASKNTNIKDYTSVTKQNPIHGLGTELGKSAKELSLESIEKTTEKAVDIKQFVSKAINESETIKNITSNEANRKSTIQSLLLSLDDPSWAIDEGKKIDLKNKLLSVTDTTNTSTDDIIREVFGAMESYAPDSTMSNFSKNRSAYAKFGKSLRAPTVDIPSINTAYNPISLANNSTEMSYLERIRNALGKDYLVQAESYKEFDIEHPVARISRITSSGLQHKANIPLRATGYYRSGASGRTLYSMVKSTMNARIANDVLSSGNASSFMKSNAITTTPEYLVSDLERRASGNNIVWGDINSNLRKLTSAIPRIGMGSDLYGTHVRWQSRQPMHGIAIQGLHFLSPTAAKETVAKLGSKMPKIFDLDISNKRIVSGTGADQTGFAAFSQGGILQKYQRTYGWDDNFDREYLPITARAHQVGGRTAAVLKNERAATKIGGLTIGSFLDSAEQQLGGSTNSMDINKALRGTSFLGEHATGGFGSVSFIDFREGEGINKGLGGLGQGFMGKRQRVRKAFDLTILDPDVHKYLSSDLLEDIMAAGDQGIYVPKERLQKNTPIGRTAEDLKSLPWNSETEGLFLKLNRVTKEQLGEGTVKSLSFGGFSEENVSMLKVFSRDHKGNLVYSQDVLSELGENKILANKALSHIGLGAEDSIVTTYDMMKKATGYLHSAIGDSAVLLGKGSITHENLRTTAANLAKAGTKGHLEAYTEAALMLMHKNNVPVELMGTVFSGVYSANMKMPGVQAHVEQIAKSLFGKDKTSYDAFTTGAKSGMMMTHTVATVADSVNDWKQGVAGVEPRFAKTYYERLMASGMKQDQAAKAVAGLYKNRMGLAKSYDFASQMLDTISYLTGTSSSHKALFDKRHKYSWNEVINDILSPNNKDNSLLEVAKKHDNGIIVNFDDAPEVIRRAAKDVFGQGEIALPGRLAHEAARGTQIKVGGDKGGTLAIDAELGRLTNEFQELIQTVSSNPKNVAGNFKSWKGKYIDLFTRSVDSLAGGKIQGGTSPEIMFYDMSGTSGILKNPKMKARAWELTQASHGQAIWQPAEGFVSQLSDISDKQDAARKAELFFTSAEQTERAMQKGIFGVEARHPIMSTGNVVMTQRYRALEELESLGGKDDFFMKFRNSSKGHGMLKSHFGLSDDAISQTSSFHALWKRNGDKKVRREFFKDFVNNLSNWTSGQQADRVIYGNIDTNIGNLSILNAGFADADGDNSISFMLGRQESKAMNELIANQNIHTTGKDFRIRSVFNLINRETKSALGNLEQKYKGNGTISVEDKMFNDVIKEINVSTNTCPLDANLRPLHEAAMMYVDGQVESDASINARLFLSNLQENFVIKSKKMPVETGISDRVISAARNLHQYDSKVYQDEFRSLMHELYAGTDFAKGKVFLPDVKAINEADQPMLEKLLGKGIRGAETSLDEILDTIMSSMRRAHIEGTSQGLTKGTLNALLEKDPLKAMNLLEGGDSFISGMLSGFNGKDTGAMAINSMGKAKRILGSIGNKNLGLMIGGVAASAAMFSMSRDFSGPEPLIMPGEMPSSSLVSKISSSRFLESDPIIEPEQLAFSGAPNNNFPVIDQRQTYLDRPNSYQIRGETSSPNGLNTFSNYFSALTNYQGRGFIRLNDTRRPITENYVDRLMGE
jgi:hypothetical protein